MSWIIKTRTRFTRGLEAPFAKRAIRDRCGIRRDSIARYLQSYLTCRTPASAAFRNGTQVPV